MKIALLLASLIVLSCTDKNHKIIQEQHTKIHSKVSKISEVQERIVKMDSLNKTLKWKRIEDDLYINKNGEIGIIAFRLLEPPETGYLYYQTCFNDDKKTPLNTVVDSETFRRIGGGGFGAYYKDSKNIYHSYGTSGGTNFSIVNNADYHTFKIINDGCAAKDKNHVYDMRFGLRENIDVKTFKVFDADGTCYAKDKNGYYRGTDLLEGDQLKDPEFLKAKKQLDKL